MERKWPFEMAPTCVLFVYILFAIIFSGQVAPPSEVTIALRDKKQVRSESSGGPTNISQLQTPWTDNSEEKRLWRPSSLTPAAFRDWVHWEPGLKFHQPCGLKSSFPCCYSAEAKHSLKLHLMLNNDQLSLNTTVTEFLQKIHNKRIVFIGDSVMQHFYQSVADLVYSELISDTNSFENMYEQKLHIHTLTSRSLNFSLINICHYVMTNTGVCEMRRAASLSWEMLQQHVVQADIILFNMGLHYHDCPKQIYISTWNRVAGILRAELLRDPKKQVILRSILPQHFPGNDGYYVETKVPQYKRTGCAKKTTMREHENNGILKATAKQYNFKYLDSFPIYMDRWDLHWREKQSVDCTHSCITAEITIPELALLNSLLD